MGAAAGAASGLTGAPPAPVNLAGNLGARIAPSMNNVPAPPADISGVLAPQRSAPVPTLQRKVGWRDALQTAGKVLNSPAGQGALKQLSGGGQGDQPAPPPPPPVQYGTQGLPYIAPPSADYLAMMNGPRMGNQFYGA